VLDFFAGTGPALHAVMSKNLEHNSSIQSILVTNNENGIADDCYKRNKLVIEGYDLKRGNKTERIKGHKNNNLRYYTCDFVDNKDTEEARRQLTRLSTALICIREDCYTDITETAGFSAKYCQIFKGAGTQYLIIIYYSREMLEVQHKLLTYIAELDTSKKIKLYGYSTAKEVLEAEFQEVEDKIEAVALPETMQEAYRAVCRSLQLV
jgi:adenine-specific DNA-methyltransferase